MSSEVRTARRRLALRAAGGGLAWSLGLLLTAVLAPLYNGQTSSDVNGLTLNTATYVQRNGAWVLILLVVPLIAGVTAAIAVAHPGPWVRRAALAAVACVALLGLLLVGSGGIVLLPAAILLGAALRLTRPAPPEVQAAGPGSRPGRGSGPRRARAWRPRRSSPGTGS